MKFGKIMISVCIITAIVTSLANTAFSLSADPGLPPGSLINRTLVKGFIDEYVIINGEITHVKHLGDAFSMGILDDIVDVGYNWEHPMESDLWAEIIRNSEGDGNVFSAEGLEKVLRVYVDGELRPGHAWLNPDQGGIDFTFKFDEPLDLQTVKNIRIECGYKSDMPGIENSVVTKSITAVFEAAKYVLDGVPLQAESLVYNNTAYYPAAYLAQQLGYSVIWYEDINATIVITGNINNQPPAATPAPVAGAGPVTKTITATFGATKYVLDGTPLAEESMVYNDIAYYPAAYLTNIFGCATSLNPDTNVTSITSNKDGDQAILTTTAPTAVSPAPKPILLTDGFINEYDCQNGFYTLTENLGDNFPVVLEPSDMFFHYEYDEIGDNKIMSVLDKYSNGDGNSYNADMIQTVLRIYVDDKLMSGVAKRLPSNNGGYFYFTYNEPYDPMKVEKIRVELGYESDLQVLSSVETP